MGELLLSDLNYHSFIDVIERYLGGAAAFVVGWSYWLCWLIIAIANTVAITGYMQFWYPNIPLWLPAFCNIALIVFINLLAVKWFGRAESWLTLIKVITIVAIIMIGLVMVVLGMGFGVRFANHSPSVWHLFDAKAFMPHGWVGFFAAFQLAVQANAGAELVGAASRETDNPAQNLPKAINQIPVRVALFFVGSLAVILMSVPLEQISIGKSPFVQLFGFFGFGMVAGVINFVALSAGISSSNSGLYSASRMVYGLSMQKNAPQFFNYLNQNGIPIKAVGYCSVYLLLSLVLLYGADNIMQAFTIISSVSSVCFVLIWAMIIIAHIRYRQITPELHANSSYKMPFSYGLCGLTLVFFVLVLGLFAQENDTALALKIVPVWVLGLLGVHKIKWR